MGAVAGVGLGLSAISSISSSEKTKKEARRAEMAERLMTAEELRRLSIEQAQVLGSAKAQIASSGFTGYGASSEAYIENLRSEQSRQQQFTKEVGGSRATAIRRSGDARASAYQMEAYGSIIQGAGKFGESFNWGLDETP